MAIPKRYPITCLNEWHCNENWLVQIDTMASYHTLISLKSVWTAVVCVANKTTAQEHLRKQTFRQFARPKLTLQQDDENWKTPCWLAKKAVCTRPLLRRRPICLYTLYSFSLEDYLLSADWFSCLVTFVDVALDNATWRKRTVGTIGLGFLNKINWRHWISGCSGLRNPRNICISEKTVWAEMNCLARRIRLKI